MNKLNDLMNESNITNEELSFKTGVALNTISKLRNQDVNCRILTIKRLSDYFNISIEFFLGYKTKNFDIEKFIKIITEEIRRCYYGNF